MACSHPVALSYAASSITLFCRLGDAHAVRTTGTQGTCGAMRED